MKNKTTGLIALYLADAAALVVFYMAGASETKLVYLAACGLILNSVILLLPDNNGKPYKISLSDYIFIPVIIAVAAAYVFFFNSFAHSAVAVTPVRAAHPAVFMLFCAVFTAVYFIMKEKTEAAENE